MENTWQKQLKEGEASAGSWFRAFGPSWWRQRCGRLSHPRQVEHAAVCSLLSGLEEPLQVRRRTCLSLSGSSPFISYLPVSPKVSLAHSPKSVPPSSRPSVQVQEPVRDIHTQALTVTHHPLISHSVPDYIVTLPVTRTIFWTFSLMYEWVTCSKSIFSVRSWAT